MVASIKQVAQQFGITYDTLRFYERCGLLTDVARNQHGQRTYSADNIVQLERVLRMRGIGASISDIQTMMHQFEQVDRVAAYDDGLRLLQQLNHDLDLREQEIKSQRALLRAKQHQFEKARDQLVRNKRDNSRTERGQCD